MKDNKKKGPNKPRNPDIDMEPFTKRLDNQTGQLVPDITGSMPQQRIITSQRVRGTQRMRTEGILSRVYMNALNEWETNSSKSSPTEFASKAVEQFILEAAKNDDYRSARTRHRMKHELSEKVMLRKIRNILGEDRQYHFSKGRNGESE